MAIYDITFHPAWWHKRTGVSFDKKFFLNPDYRIQADMLMRRFLFENFPEIYPSESYMVQPRPLIDSNRSIIPRTGKEKSLENGARKV